MEKLIKEINKIIGNFTGSQLTIRFFNDNEVVFYIYEQEIPIQIDKKNKHVYLDCEVLSKEKLTSDMLLELSKIMKLMECEIEVILSCLMKD